MATQPVKNKVFNKQRSLQPVVPSLHQQLRTAPASQVQNRRLACLQLFTPPQRYRKNHHGPHQPPRLSRPCAEALPYARLWDTRKHTKKRTFSHHQVLNTRSITTVYYIMYGILQYSTGCRETGLSTKYRLVIATQRCLTGLVDIGRLLYKRKKKKKTHDGNLTVKYGENRHPGVSVRLHLLESPLSHLRKARPRDVSNHDVFRLVCRAAGRSGWPTKSLRRGCACKGNRTSKRTTGRVMMGGNVLLPSLPSGKGR